MDSLARMVDLEWRILLRCATTETVTPDLEPLLSSPAVDWQRLRLLAARERALGTVWRVIRSARGTTMPAEERETWQQIAMVTEFRSMYMEDRLRQTLAVLGRAGIDVVVLKGAALALTVYGSFTEREMGDIDLLVDASRAEEAFRLARETGWRWDEASYPGNRYRNHHHLPPLRDGRDTEARLELHTRLSPEGHPLGYTLSELRQLGALAPLPGGGATGWTLTPAMQLLHVAVHFAWSHEFTFGAWRTFRDADRLLSRLAGGEEGVVAAARRERVTACLYWTLRLSRAFAGGRAADATGGAIEGGVSPGYGGVRLSSLGRHHAQALFRFGGVLLSARWNHLMWEMSLRPDLEGRGGIRPWLVMEPQEVSSASAGRVPGSRWSGHLRRARLLMAYAQGVLTGEGGGARG